MAFKPKLTKSFRHLPSPHDSRESGCGINQGVKRIAGECPRDQYQEWDCPEHGGFYQIWRKSWKIGTHARTE
jgi:hypothetical protein